jgi:hypothetical protein
MSFTCLTHQRGRVRRYDDPQTHDSSGEEEVRRGMGRGGGDWSGLNATASRGERRGGGGPKKKTAKNRKTHFSQMQLQLATPLRQQKWVTLL